MSTAILVKLPDLLQLRYFDKLGCVLLIQGLDFAVLEQRLTIRATRQTAAIDGVVAEAEGRGEAGPWIGTMGVVDRGSRRFVSAYIA